MFRRKIKAPMQKLITMVMLICMVFILSSSVHVELETSQLEENIKIGEQVNENQKLLSKIDIELSKIIDVAEEDEVIKIWLILKSQDENTLRNLIKIETGMDPDVFEDEVRFYAEIVPVITAEVEKIAGYHAAHYKEVPEYKLTTYDVLLNNKTDVISNNDKNDTVDAADIATAWPSKFGTKDDNMDQTISLVDRAINAKYSEYILAKREITKREYSNFNSLFIEKNVPAKRNILYKSLYTSSIILEATKNEILNYARNADVERLSLFVDDTCKPASN